ncbi:unnamed protein product [Malus baccata var. baccata]
MPADENKEPKPIPLWIPLATILTSGLLDFLNSKKYKVLRLDKVKGTLPRREDELAKAIQKNIGRKNTTESKPTKNASSSKNTCICAPTKHEGSFRCHLHRTSLVAQNTNKSNLNAKNGHHDVVEKHARLSRFGRAASARNCHGNLSFVGA